MRTSVTFEGNLAQDPRVRFTASGKQITEITVLVNERRQNSDGAWVDTEPTRHVVRAFKTLAENVVESLAKGDRVFVHGTITTDAWTDKECTSRTSTTAEESLIFSLPRESGDKRTAQRVLAKVVGPSLRWATTRITKTTRTLATDEKPRDVSEREA